jgi:hypothetical protein
MKKVLIGLVLAATAIGANAQMIHGHGWVGPSYYRHHGHGGDWNWVAPAIIGGAVVYAATRPPVVVQQPQPIIVQQTPVDVVYINGIAYKKQIMIVNGQEQEVLVRL